MSFDVPQSHPRYLSLTLRHRITEGYKNGITASAGLIAHGRGEAFDYLIGEESCPFALKAVEAAAALFLISEKPIICVNGNSVVLCPEETVKLGKLLQADLEVNLFYRTTEREKAIEDVLIQAGADHVLGVELGDQAAHIDEIDHARRVVDPKGIAIADTVFVPLEDGDRTEALIKAGKKVITVDLNPLSRTAQKADITIVDNIVRAMKELNKAVKSMKDKSKAELQLIVDQYDNHLILKQSIQYIGQKMQTKADNLSPSELTSKKSMEA